MASRRRVRELLDGGMSLRDVGEQLGIPAGQVHLIATGVPADGGDVLPAADRERSGAEVGAQRLANPPAENPTSKEHVRRWIRSRVESDGPLRDAAARRGTVPGDVREPDAGDAIVVLTRDHNRIKAALLQLKTLPAAGSGGSPEQVREREALVERIDAAMSVHEAIEREHFWPAVRSALPDGDQWADGAARLDQRIRRTLDELREQSADSDEFDRLAGQLPSQVHQHVAHQERLFLGLRESTASERLDELGARLRSAKKAASGQRGPQRPLAIDAGTVDQHGQR